MVVITSKSRYECLIKTDLEGRGGVGRASAEMTESSQFKILVFPL